MYADLLKFTQELAHGYGRIPSILKMRADPRPEFAAEGDKNLTKCLNHIAKSNVSFGRATLLAFIFTMPECVALLKDFLSTRTRGPSITAEWAASEGNKFGVLLNPLTTTARKDLGLES